MDLLALVLMLADVIAAKQGLENVPSSTMEL